MKIKKLLAGFLAAGISLSLMTVSPVSAAEENRSSIFRHYHQQHCRLAPGT